MEDQAAQLLEKLQNEWAPEAIRLGEQMFFWWGLGNIVTGFVLLILSLVALYVGWSLAHRHANIKNNRKNSWDESGEGYFVASIIAYGICAILCVFWSIYLFNIWNWIAIFQPRLAMAHEIFVKLLAK